MVAGLGDFVAAEAARRAGLEVTHLSASLGPAARTAPAAAVACLLAIRLASGDRMTHAGLTVVKVGGGLSRTAGALDAVAAALAAAGRRHRIVVVPGGGPFADAVRAFEDREGLSADAAHWMAILAMDQYAHVLAERIAGATLVEEPGAVAAALGAAGVAVLAPYRWMRAADVLPHTWSASSDSVAAFVAGALDAERLVLIKPADGRVREDAGGWMLRDGAAARAALDRDRLETRGGAERDAGLGIRSRGRCDGDLTPPLRPCGAA